MLIIFDFDGVLRSISWEGIFEAYKALAKYKGLDYKKLFKEIDEFKKWFNPDWHINLEKLGGFRADELGKINEIYHSYYDPYVGIFDWADDLLRDLSSRHELAMLSASSLNSINGSAGDLRNYFSAIIGNDHVARIKPDPEGIHLIVRKLGACYNETVLIGDTEADIVAGKSAGIKTGAVKWGGISSWDQLVSLEPDYQFHKPEELFLL